jgi:hypothetical protein
MALPEITTCLCVWTNELRSVMLLREAADHSLTGVFHSLVGRDSGFRSLAGRSSLWEDGKQMVGFAVSFEIGNPAEGKMYFSRSAANRMSAF